MNKKALRNIFLVTALLVLTAIVGMLIGYRRGYNHGEIITNKWWIDQQSQYYDAAEIEKKRRAQHVDVI